MTRNRQERPGRVYDRGAGHWLPIEEARRVAPEGPDLGVVRPVRPRQGPAEARFQVSGPDLTRWQGGECSALDLPIRARSGRVVTFGGALAALEKAGLTFADRSAVESAAGRFLDGATRSSSARAAKGAGGGAQPPPGVDGAKGEAVAGVRVARRVRSEEGVSPDAMLGVANTPMAFHRDLSALPAAGVAVDDIGTVTSNVAAVNQIRRDHWAETADQWGQLGEVVADLAALGAGGLRRFPGADLTWRSLFGEQVVSGGRANIWAFQVPPPGDVASWISGNNYEAMTAVGWLVFLCHVYGLELSPTLFDSLGGTGATGELALSGTIPGPSEEMWDRVLADHPAWQNEGGVLFTSGLGWDPFYYGVTELGFSTSVGLRPLIPHAQYALQLWYDDAGGLDLPSAATYRKRSAIRKALFLAAFSDAVGEYLVRLEAAIQTWDSTFSLAEVIPYFEVANEPGSLWNRNQDGSHQELARYAVHLVAPIMNRLPNARFRFAELASDAKPAAEHTDEFDAMVLFVRDAHAYAIGNEFGRWQALLDGSDPDAEEWRGACVAAGYQWPPDAPFAFTGSGMFHQVGFHWYHCYNEDPGRVLYLSGARLIRDVSRMARAFGSLSISLGEFGFQATTGLIPPTDPYYTDTNPTFQASMLVRLALLARGAGVERSYWHTFLSVPQLTLAGPWGPFSSMGLRNDIATPLDGVFSQEEDAYRRPAWYSFRRLVWLLNQADDVILHINRNNGQVCVQLYAEGGFSTDPTVTSEPSLDYAYIPWIDQDSLLQFAPLTLRSASEQIQYTLLSLAPAVNATSVSDSTTNGYPESDDPEWEWAGWDAGLRAARTSRSRTSFEVEVLPADPVANPGLVCIFSNTGTMEF